MQDSVRSPCISLITGKVDPSDVKNRNEVEQLKDKLMTLTV